MPTKLSKIIADFETQLATKLSAGSDSCNLQSATDDDGVALTDGQYFFTLDGDNSQKEHIVATLTGIALSDIKSISRQGVQIDNAVREHRIGASVKITDFAHIKYMNDLLDGTTSFDSAVKLGYDADPGIDSSDLYKFATVAFVNDSLVSGAPNASTTVKGIVEEATTAEIDADDTTGGTGARLSINPSSLILSKYGLQLPSVGEKAALTGSSGQVNTYNKYLTEDDASNFGGGVSQALQNSVLAIGEANATTKFNKAMETFIATNTSQIAVNVNKQANTGTNAGDVIVELFAVDGSSNPTGSALASATITAAAWNALPIGNNYTVLNYTFVIGTTYALQFRQSTADNANHANIGYQNTDVYANGVLKRWNTTDGWVAVTGDLTFYLFGSINNKVVRRTNNGTVYSPSPSAGSDLANKTYVDALLTTLASLNFAGVGSATGNKNNYNYILPILFTGSISDAIWTLGNLSNTKYQGNYGFNWTPTASNNNMSFSAIVRNSVGAAMTFGTKAIVTEFDTILNSVGTNDFSFGLGEGAGALAVAYNSASARCVRFSVDRTTSKLYAHTSNAGGGANHTEVEITGVTLTDANTFRIEYTPGVSALFYVNGVLKATITTTLPTSGSIVIGWGALYQGSGSITNYPTAISAPALLIQK